MKNIHPTALVNPEAKLGENIIVGPFALIESDVEIGDDCIIGPHAVIYNGARLGNRVKIFQGVSIANLPQDLKFGGEKTLLIIGDDTVVREFATLHRGTLETGKSQVGKNCLLMAYSHIPHDCSVGDNCIIANSVQIGGHSHIEDWVIIGGLAGLHQFSRVGEHSMIAGAAKVTQDVPPYILAAHNPAEFNGLNVIGLRRRGFKAEDIQILKEAYGYLYSKSLNVSQAVEVIKSKFGDNIFVQKLLDFLSKSKRGIVGK
ncbi:MAG: acyl-ACP--UDP-N-acetylglucosamine O-acyltransferase [Ignavibacteriaceae bacterium]|jgi:UDP-N-acetylglucosamine acyltransferase|nr:acyl-ACP--UDP-N-acetylglucosamine O-acyltransferase [Ignavibacteriaceae bacterium]MCW8812975.1 acyl-ACP--UDP-N-acetylglucosamine O-acyltransferase [Chlorobium sp.]MCW8995657.1 acyl-ACP--UDP-N-acetylglucosamine O-acyltransferase [Psychromonas sp.]MCW8823773.1 acyl-ACP--UDP-N-acetylglucosamine O-acyltransferase [Ignavibacteriaceae bacterium]MCW8960594.1 acyl-ACP--UDP-N-acetylglucosamine O-acyltransferase [Ignavibacteriaceae bacterium]